MRIDVDGHNTVSAILHVPDGATSLYVMAHGAGAGMTHPFMASVADGLATRSVATLRYQFPSMETGSRRPDRPALAQATVRAAVEAARHAAPSLPLYAGGKSFGGRMTSQAQAADPMPGVHGLVFFGFPLHPAKRPSVDRAVHLNAVAIPMLFLQGTRDGLAEMPLLESTIERLGSQATLAAIEGADHSFHVPARSDRTDAEVLAAMLDTVAAWITDH
jgi:predicted alpha/beta-hydrolase family hydrolase